MLHHIGLDILCYDGVQTKSAQNFDGSLYEKEVLYFLLVAELLVDKAMELKYVGGVYGGNVKPAPFLCLLLKMLQIQPEKDIIVEFISQPDFK